MRQIALATLVFTALSSCLLRLKADAPVAARLAVPTVRISGDAEITSDGLTVAVTPISGDNVPGFPQIWKTVTVATPMADGRGGTAMRDVPVSLSIAPLPAFQVRIANNTGHVIRLTTAIFRLESNTGKRWNTFASTEELVAWNAGIISTEGIEPLAQAQVMQQIQAAVGALQFLNRSVELLKGDEWSGYLVFNLGTTKQSDYFDFMNSTERFTLRMAEVPIETGDAGEVTKTTEFHFVLDKSSTEIAAECPPGTTAPSWDAGCVPVR